MIPLIDPGLAELIRWAYVIFAFVACGGFLATLVMRWDLLEPGKRLLWAGLGLEHAVLVYGGWVAVRESYPPTLVGLALAISLGVVLTGLGTWIAGMVLEGELDPQV